MRPTLWKHTVEQFEEETHVDAMVRYSNTFSHVVYYQYLITKRMTKNKTLTVDNLHYNYAILYLFL